MDKYLVDRLRMHEIALKLSLVAMGLSAIGFVSGVAAIILAIYG